MRLSLEALEDRTLLSGGTPLAVVPGTVGLWHLDEGSGLQTADASGFNPAGTLVNSPQWVAGNLDNALHFNGSSQYVNVKQGPILGSTPNFTVEAWVKWDGGGAAGHQFVYSEGSYNDIIDLYLSNGVPSFTTLGANWYTASAAAPLPVGEWHFLAAVLQSGVGGSLYVDGQLAAVNPNMGAGSQFAGETDIGRFAGNGGSRYFPGSIDEVRVRTVAETAAEILADYQQTAGQVTTPSVRPATGGTPLIVAPGTSGLWHLDEGTGGTTADASGTNGPGVLVNAPQWVPGTLGNALHFDGATQYVRVKQGAVLASAANFTVEAWVKWDGGGAAGHQFIYSEGSYNDIIDLYLSNGVPSFTTLGANWYTASAAAPLAAGEWHFLAGVLQAGVGGTLYVDGQAVATNPNMGAGSQFAGETDIGRFAGNGGSRYFHGTIDEVRVRTVAQPASEILADYQQTRATPQVTLISVGVTPAAPTLVVGQTQQFTAAGTFSDGTSRPLTSGGGAWADDPAMPTARHYPAAAVINGILYVVGGNSNSITNLTTLEAYDPATQTWTTKAPLPTARHGLAVAVVNGILYAMGGSGNNQPVLATVEAYDPATNTWTTKAPMSTPRTYFGAAVVNGLIYAVGGSPTGVTPLASVEAYDPHSNTWTPRAPLNTARWAVSVANVNGTLYAVGGRVGSSNVATVESYNPTTNAWTLKAPLPTTWGFPALGVVNGTLYAVGGDVNELPSATVRRYDPSTDTWPAETPLPAPREALAAGVVNGVLYAVGGWNGTNSVATVQAYTPSDNLTWSTSDSHVATIDANGLATMVGTGPVTITATASGVCGSAQFTVVGKAEQSLTFDPIADRTYGDGPFTLAATASSGLPAQFTVLSGPATIADNVITLTGAGTVVVKATQAGNAAYDAATAIDQSFQVAAAPLTVTARDASRRYGEPNPAFAVDYSGFVNGDGFNSLGGVLSFTTSASTASDAGGYQIVPGGLAAPNYAITYAPGLLTVNRADQQISWATPAAIVYGSALGAAQLNATVSVVGPAAAGALTYDRTAGEVLDAGTYTLTVTAAATNNYNKATGQVTLVVQQATPTVQLGSVIVSFDGQPHGTTAEVFGIGGADLGSASVTYNTTDGSVPLHAGNYTATALFGGNNNYTPAAGTAAISISRATPTVVVYPVTATYDGQPHGTGGEVFGVTHADLGPAAISYLGDQVPVNAGSYSANGSFDGNTDYVPAVSLGLITINQATPTVVVTPVTVTYDGQPHGTTATAFGIHNVVLGAADVTYSSGSAPISAGSYTAAALFAGDTNYTSASGSATITITPAATAVAVTSSLNPAIAGQAITFTATVAVVAPGAGIPTGSVTFRDGPTPLATIALQWLNGTALATFTTAALPAGSHAITATYAGDANFGPGTSAILSQTVQTPQQALQGLVSVQIPALVSSGVLSAAQANALIATLNNAIARINAGNPQTAANQLNAFMNKVDALNQSGRLSDAEAQSLLDVAELILLLLA